MTIALISIENGTFKKSTYEEYQHILGWKDVFNHWKCKGF